MWSSAAYDFPADLPGFTRGGIVELNRKDAFDIINLIFNNEVGSDDRKINLGRIAELCVSDWGLYKTNSITLGGGESLDVILDASNTTLYPSGSVFYLYTPNLDHLSNDAENFGGLMTEVHIN